VILDYESAEKVIADRRGTTVSPEMKPPPVPEPEKKITSREIVIKKAEEKTEKVEEQEEQVEKEVIPEAETVENEEVIAEDIDREHKEEITLEKEPSEVTEPESVAKEIETADQEKTQAQKSISDILGQEEEKEEPPTLHIGKEEKKSEIVELFYQTIKDDIKIINRIVSNWKNGDLGAGDLSQILFSLKIITTHPLLKKLGNIKQLFEQVKKSIAFFEEHIDELRSEQIIESTKELLKYIGKENIIKNSDNILEQINELGIKLHQLKEEMAKKTPEHKKEVDSIREKIAKKNLIKNISILESISRSNKD